MSIVEKFIEMPGNKNFKRKAAVLLEKAFLQEEVDKLVRIAKTSHVQAEVNKLIHIAKTPHVQAEVNNTVRIAKAPHNQANVQESTSLVSDSSEDDTAMYLKPRKRRKPLRYQSSYSSESEPEYVLASKKYHIPNALKFNNAPSISTNISDFQGVSNAQQDSTSSAIYIRLFEYLEKINDKVEEINSKVDRLTSQVEILSCVSKATPPLMDVLPNDVKLPVESIAELELLNEKLKGDQEFCALLIRYLFNAGSGKSQCSFILSLTKRVLNQEVAVQFSRFGRKGKQSFIKYNETLNVILAAASLKFPNGDREVLAEMFGKALASASDWNGRKSRPSDSPIILSIKCENPSQ